MFQVYENVFDDESVEHLLNLTRNMKYCQGRVGNCVNLKQKNRKDLYIKTPNVLRYIDDIVYDTLYEDVRKTFGKRIDFRESWKIGFYDSLVKGFYNLHTDDSRETKYRNISMVCALSDPNDYEGGILRFPKLNKEFKLAKGSVIVFDSSLLHGVTEVTKGERKVLISFFFDEVGAELKKLIMKIPDSNITFIDNYRPLLTNFKIEYKTSGFLTCLGDIDYSDIKNKSWTDVDDFIFEKNDSETLFISFAGMGWKQSIPTFNFYNFMKSYKNVDKLFLRDTGPPNSSVWMCRYYLLGFRHNTNSLEESIEFIRNLIGTKYKKIVAFGCSAGGFAAMLYGNLLKFDEIIVFNGQSVINHVKDEIIKDVYNAPRTCRFLSMQRKESDLYQKCLDLKSFQPFHPKISFHYSDKSNKGCDKLHAEYLKFDKNIRLIEHDSRDHLLALELKRSGDLKSIIDKCLCN
jgi:predicted 2-oxoglutarate/Fe(II)-dependent dioxygenase YbiX